VTTTDVDEGPKGVNHGPRVSVVIPAHNPPAAHFQRVLEALRAQTLLLQEWELIVVDDGSRVALADSVDVSWHQNARIVGSVPQGEGVGLVGARLAGFESGSADIFVYVDQDNVLHPDFLAEVVDIGRDYPWLGAWGGQISLHFDEPAMAPEKWLWPLLCARKLEGDVWSNDTDHYASTPWGAGLCVRRPVLENHRDKVNANPLRRHLDPTPGRMGFGGDTDLVNTACAMGYGKGVFERLRIDHLIPVGRCSDEYFLQSAEARGYSAVLHGFLDEGVARPPRSDIRFWVLTLMRWPRMRRLERKLLLRARRGEFAAVRDLAVHRG